MTNKLVVITNSLKVPKIKKILLYGMKFLAPNYSCPQNPSLGDYSPPQIPVLSVLCPQLNLLTCKGKRRLTDNRVKVWPGKVLRVPGGWGSQISRQLAREGDEVVSPYPS